MQIAILQQNYILGDFKGNCQKITAAYRQAVAAGAGLICTPAAAITGFPSGDLAKRESFLAQEKAALDELKNLISTVPLLTTDCHFQPLVCVQGEIRRPEDPAFVEFNGLKAFLIPQKCCTVTEIVAYLSDLPARRPNLLIQLTAMPFALDQVQELTTHYQDIAVSYGLPVVYANQIGSQGGLVFSGESCLIGADGHLLASGAAFAEDLINSEVILPKQLKSSTFIPHKEAGNKTLTHKPGWEKAATAAICLCLKDYMAKCGFKKALIGLSGGIDSALVATLAVRALGAENVMGITMPSRYSPADSPNDAINLAHNLGIEVATIPIEPIFAQGLNSLEPLLGAPPWGVTQENLQARIRGMLLMSYSNKFGHLVLATGNKSELAVGYSTLYGDMCGAFELIGDLYKTEVYQLSQYLNDEAGRELIPHSTLTKPPSAELAPGQRDQDSLPPYDILDDILRRYMENNETIAAITAAGHDPAVINKVITLLRRAEYKRCQSAPIIKLTTCAFGHDWHSPLAHNFKG